MLKPEHEVVVVEDKLHKGFDLHLAFPGLFPTLQLRASSNTLCPLSLTQNNESEYPKWPACPALLTPSISCSSSRRARVNLIES